MEIEQEILEEQCKKHESRCTFNENIGFTLYMKKIFIKSTD